MVRARPTVPSLPHGMAPWLSCVLVHLLLATLVGHEPPRDSDAPPPGKPAEELAQAHEQLLATRNDLIIRANQAYQNGELDAALQLLEQLLPLYDRLYPAAEFPNGSLDAVECYVDFCRVADRCARYDLVLKRGREGIAVARRVFSQDQFPAGHVYLAGLLSNVGVAHFHLGEFQDAQAMMLEALAMLESLEKSGAQPSLAVIISRVLTNLGTVLAAKGDFTGAKSVFQRAIARQEALAPEHDDESLRSAWAASCCYYGACLWRLGEHRAALESLEKSYDIRFRLYLSDRTEGALVNVVDVLTEMGALHQDAGNTLEAHDLFWRLHSKVVRLDETRRDRRMTRILIHLLELSRQRGCGDRDAFLWRSLRPLILRISDESTAQLDLYSRVDLLVRYGTLCLAEGDLQSSLQALSRANATISRESSAGDGAAISFHHVQLWGCLARLYDEMGSYDKAHVEHARCVMWSRRLFAKDAHAHARSILGWVLLNAAMHCWIIGETDLANETLAEAMDIVEGAAPPGSDHIPMLERQLAYSSRARVLLRENDLLNAELYCRRSHDMILTRRERNLDSDRGDDLIQSWIDLGRIRRAQGDFPGARGFFRRALESYEARGVARRPDEQLSMALMLTDLGLTDAEEGDLASGKTYLQRALALRRGLFPADQYPAGHPSVANAERDLGIICLRAGEHRQAFELLSESARIEHAIGEAFFGGVSEAQLLNLAARKFQSLGPLLQAWEHAALPAEAVYVHVWNRHGLVPRLIAQRQRRLREGTRQDDAGRYEKYVQARQSLDRALLVSLSDEQQQHSAQLAQLEQLRRAKEELEQQLTETWELPSEPPDASKTVQALSRVLPDRAAFVDFYAYARWPFDATLPSRAGCGEVDRMVAFVVTRDRPVACVDLGDPRTLTALVDSWYEEMEHDAPPLSGVALREKIWDPIAAALPPQIETVYVAPDGPAARVPWSALPCPSGMGVLLEQYAFATVPYGALLLEQLRSTPCDRSSWTPALAVADVDYGDRDAQATPSSQGLKQLVWTRLAASRRELDAIVASLGDRDITTRTGRDASATAVLADLGRVRLAHLATHGFFLDDPLTEALRLVAKEHVTPQLKVNPSRASLLARSPFLRSGLALAGANLPATVAADGLPEMAEGFLTAESVAALDAAQLDLVVLSACDTTRGDLAAGDGVLGIQNAFHIAGARNVISGLWRIPDDAAADLMAEFYRRLVQPGGSPLTALRGAQLQLARQADPAIALHRGAELARTVPLPAATARPIPHWCRGVRRWAGFNLSGPGF